MVTTTSAAATSAGHGEADLIDRVYRFVDTSRAGAVVRSTMASFLRTTTAWPWLSGLLLGCSTSPLYSWGPYEAQIYSSSVPPASMSPEAQVAQLEQDYQKASAENKRMPPGFHAQLGYLYFQLGRLDQARRDVQTEKTEVPGSAVRLYRLRESPK